MWWTTLLGLLRSRSAHWRSETITHTHTRARIHTETHIYSHFLLVLVFIWSCYVFVSMTCPLVIKATLSLYIYYIYIRPLVLQNLIVLTVKLFLCSYLPSHPFLFALTNPPYMYIYLLVSLLFINPAPLHLKI